MITFHDILYPKYFSEAQLKRRAEIEETINTLWEESVNTLCWGKVINIRTLPEYKKAIDEKDSIYRNVRDYYISSRGKNLIYEDTKLVINSVEQIDYKNYIASVVAEYFSLKEAGLKEDYEGLEKIPSEDYEGCFSYILSFLDLPLTVFIEDETYTKKIMDLVKARVSLWYVAPESNYLPVLRGKATDALALMATKSSLLKVDKISHAGKITIGKDGDEVKGVIKNFENIAGSLGVSTHKLLMTGISVFCENNHTGAKARQAKRTEVLIPLKEYASKCGYDVEIHPTDTPEEAKKEAKRAKNALDNARKKINKDLELLYEYSLSWSERVRGKTGDYRDVRIIDEKGVENGYIRMNIAKSFSDYLIGLPMNQYPIALLGLDERNPNAYNIGLQLSYHFNLDNNIGKGTAQLLKVKTILQYTDLPSIEEVRAKSRSWVERVKESLEKALESLVGCGLLESWEYCHSKGVPLTDKEAGELINIYEEWIDTLVKYTLKDAPDHRDRLEAKAKRIEENKAKNAKKTKKTSKKSSSDKATESEAK